MRALVLVILFYFYTLTNKQISIVIVHYGMRLMQHTSKCVAVHRMTIQEVVLRSWRKLHMTVVRPHCSGKVKAKNLHFFYAIEKKEEIHDGITDLSCDHWAKLKLATMMAIKSFAFVMHTNIIATLSISAICYAISFASRIYTAIGMASAFGSYIVAFNFYINTTI